MCKVLSKLVRSHFPNLRKNPRFSLTTALNDLNHQIQNNIPNICVPKGLLKLEDDRIAFKLPMDLILVYMPMKLY